MAIKHRSAKNKGYKLQKDVAKLLLEKFDTLEQRDIVSAPSSVSGEDLILSERARKLLPVNFECKCQEALSVWAALEQVEKESKKLKTNPILVFKRNRTPTYTTIRLEFLIELLYNYSNKCDKTTNKTLFSKIQELNIFNDNFIKKLSSNSSID